MSDLDLTEATKAAYATGMIEWPEDARVVLEAAVPLIEAQLRERIAADIERAPVSSSDYWTTQTVASVLREAARIARGGAP